jgi:CRISPR-associated protein Csm5
MQYKVTALTPLLVGDGRELAPIDYMVWKDQVNVLDQTRIFRLLSRGPRLDGYLAQLRKATKLDFASWGGFAQNFSARRIPFENPDSTAVWNAASSENLFIPTFAAALNGPYLPASSIKGALRTGLLFTRWSASTLERIATSIEGDRLPRRTSEAAESSAGASQTRILSLADGKLQPNPTFKIYLSRVASLDTRQPDKPQLVWKIAGRGSVPANRIGDSTPQFVEMAAPGTVFSGTYDSRNYLENPDAFRALGWRSAPDPQAIIGACNDYAAAQLNLHQRFADVTGLAALRSSIDNLKVELERIRHQPLSCLMCLGWGGGFVSKAAYLETADPSYRRVLRSVPSISRALRENIPFPKTRRIVFMRGQPATLPGWVTAQFAL